MNTKGSGHCLFKILFERFCCGIKENCVTRIQIKALNTKERC